MAITPGSLTERLGQMIDAIAVFFSEVGNKLDSVIALLTDLTSPNLLDGKTNLESVRYQASATANAANQIAGILLYLTRSGDGTDLNRNLQSVVDEIYALGGPRSAHATLYDLFEGIGTNTASGNLRDMMFDLLSAGAFEDGRMNLWTMNQVLIAIKNRIGTAQNGLSAVELLQVVSECICELNAKTPDPNPPADTFPAGHACAPSNAELLFTIGPSDWYQSQNGTWYGCPASLQAAMGTFWVGAEKIPQGDNAVRRMLQYIGSYPPDFNSCYVTSSQSTESLTLYPLHGKVVVEQSYEASFNFGADVVGVQDAAGGCKNMPLLTSDSLDVYWRLLYQPAGGTGGDSPAPGTLYFYRVPV